MPHNWIKKHLNILKTVFANKWRNETAEVVSDIYCHYDEHRDSSPHQSVFTDKWL